MENTKAQQSMSATESDHAAPQQYLGGLLGLGGYVGSGISPARLRALELAVASPPIGGLTVLDIARAFLRFLEGNDEAQPASATPPDQATLKTEPQKYSHAPRRGSAWTD